MEFFARLGNTGRITVRFNQLGFTSETRGRFPRHKTTDDSSASFSENTFWNIWVQPGTKNTTFLTKEICEQGFWALRIQSSRPGYGEAESARPWATRLRLHGESAPIQVLALVRSLTSEKETWENACQTNVAQGSSIQPCLKHPYFILDCKGKISWGTYLKSPQYLRHAYWSKASL